MDADGLETEEMQRVSAWTNLSVTTFLLPPTEDTADYRRFGFHGEVGVMVASRFQLGLPA